MAASATALWLDSFFAGYDHFFLKLLHGMAEKLGAVMTPLMRAITFLGEKGILFFLLALIFMLMVDKRDLGVCIFGAVCCGALITNIILKDNVARVRPFMNGAEYEAWWAFVGAPLEDGFSFPSGHVTACAAGMTAITLMRGRKWLVPSVVIVLLMGISRNYLMAHYPSDVLVAALIGVFSGFVAWFITQFIFNFLRRRRRAVPVFATILDFDVRDYLPFELPSLPVKKGAVKSAFAGKKESRSARRAAPAEEVPEEDEDVKTYDASASRRAARPAPDSDAPVRRAERRPRPAAVPAEEAEAVPVRARAASARGKHAIAGSTGGKHAIAAPARKSPSLLSGLGSSGKKGKHELDSPKRLASSGKKGRHEL